MSVSRVLFATAVLLGARIGGADTLPYAADAVLVLDAQSGLATNELGVVGWSDLSSGGHDGTVNTLAKPQVVPEGLNGHPVVQFNGDASLLLSGQVLSSQQFTIFALVTDESSSAYREILSNWAFDNMFSSVFFGTAGEAVRTVRLTDQSQISQPLCAQTGFSVLSGVYNDSGTIKTFQGATSLSSATVAADRNLTTFYYIGVQGVLNDEFWVGKMAEVIVYNRALSESECAEVRSYLVQHWLAAPGVPYASDAALVLDAQNGVATNGVNVTGWYDLSSSWNNGVINTVASPQLVANGLNGHPVVQFNGDASLLLSGQVLTSQQFTVFALVTDESSGGDREIVSNWRADNSTNSVFFGTSGGSLARAIRLTDANKLTTKNMCMDAPTAFSVLSGVYNDNGIGRTYQRENEIESFSANADRVLTTPYYLGVQGNYEGREYWVGKMAEVIVYNRLLSSSECADVRSYLAQHWAASGPVASEAVANLAGLCVWLDASDGATVCQTFSAGSVNGWCDKSGHGNDVGAWSPSAMPSYGGATLNGLNLVSFDGSGADANYWDRLHNLSMTSLGDSSRTVIFLSTSFNTADSDIVVGLGSTAGVENSGWGITDTTIFGMVGPNDVGFSTEFGNRGGGVPQIMEVSYDNALPSGQIKRWANGTVVTAGTSRPNSGYATTNGYSVSGWGDPNRPFSGNVAEVLIFDRAINAAERIVLENYLAAKWNPDSPVIGLAAQRYEGYTTANGNYDWDVWGIGRVNGDNQVLAGGMVKGLSLSASSLSDDGWLLAGHKTATNSTLTAASALEPGVKERWARVWYLDKRDANGGFTVTLTFDFSDAGVAPTSGPEYDLLYSAAREPFSFRSVRRVQQSDGRLVFTLSSQQLPNGYYTIGRAVRGTMVCIR